MITKEILENNFGLVKKKMDGNKFITKFILPFEKKSKNKIILSENHDDYLLNIKKGNI